MRGLPGFEKRNVGIQSKVEEKDKFKVLDRILSAWNVRRRGIQQILSDNLEVKNGSIPL